MSISLYSTTKATYNQAMQLTTKLVCLSVAVTLVSLAAAPVARVISTQPVNVNGILGPARNFVPLAVGDEVTTDSASAVVQFPDGRAVTLQAHSKLRIEAQPSGPVARVLQGSAIFDEARTPSSPVNSAGKPGRVPPVGSGATPGILYRSPAARQSGAAAPQAMVFTGSFKPAASAGGTGPQIIGPNGATMNLTAVVNPTTGATTYVVSSIQQTVTTPDGGTAVVTVTSGPLIGATVGGTTGTTITFTQPGSTTSLTPDQVAAALQTEIQQAINTAVTNGTLPAGTKPPSPAPVKTGQFSPSGS